MNPADAFRKVQVRSSSGPAGVRHWLATTQQGAQLMPCCSCVQRAKEIARNKKERKFQRDASKLKSNPDALKEELKEVQFSNQHGKCLQTTRKACTTAFAECRVTPRPLSQP